VDLQEENRTGYFYQTQIGFMQMPGVDYTESFAPVALDTAISVIITFFLCCHHTDKKAK
jgi:hypothetical protein